MSILKVCAWGNRWAYICRLLYVPLRNKIIKPIVHLTYVDDIFAIFKSHSNIRFFLERVEKKSVLNFTYEKLKNNTFNFLDVKTDESSDGNFTISMYKNVADTGLYTNFKSHTPENYKPLVVKTLLARAIQHSSTWNTFHVELDRLCPVFENIGYPQTLAENIVKNKISQHLSNRRKSIKFLRTVIQHRNFQKRRTPPQTNSRVSGSSHGERDTSTGDA